MPLDSHLFDEHMRDGSALTQLLKGHLWVEHCVNRAVEITVKEASRINIDRMSFSAKLDLAMALDALPAEFEPALRRLNKIRNDAAHDLRFALTEEMMASMVSSLGSMTRPGWERIHTSTDSLSDQLRKWIHVIVFAAEWQNVQREYYKVNSRSLDAYELIKALEQGDGGEQTPDDELRARYGVPPLPTAADVWTVTRMTPPDQPDS
jgi:hypothetical protein